MRRRNAVIQKGSKAFPEVVLPICPPGRIIRVRLNRVVNFRAFQWLVSVEKGQEEGD